MAKRSVSKKKTARTKKTARKPGPAAVRRAGTVLEELERLYPDADCALRWSNPLQLLVATILSAQCTDARVNMVTESLFRKYRTAKDYAGADPEEFQDDIRSTGFFRNKTKSILGMAAALVADHGGEVPQTVDELVALPGVARKTANVVLGTAFGKNEGVVVDTHVFRLSHRLGLSEHSDSNKVEQDLMHALPRDKWTFAGHALILHGRQVCDARKPRCDDCTLAEPCPSAFRA